MTFPDAPPVVTAKRPPKRMSLRKRVTLLAAVCVAGAVALVSFGAYWTVRGNLYQELDDRLIERAQGAVSAPPLDTQMEQMPLAFLTTADMQIGVLAHDPSSRGARMVNPIGHAPPWGVPELRVARGDLAISLRTERRTNARVVAMQSGPGEAMVLAQPLDPTQDILRRLAVVLFVISGAGVVVAAVAGTAVARGGLRPVQTLTAATERVAATGDLRPITVSGDDELARLTLSFNQMLAAVSDAQRRQRQLVADAGHELRTPLTSLRTNLELLLAADRPGARSLSPEDRSEIEQDITGQLDERHAADRRPVAAGPRRRARPPSRDTSCWSTWSSRRWSGPAGARATSRSTSHCSRGRSTATRARSSARC